MINTKYELTNESHRVFYNIMVITQNSDSILKSIDLNLFNNFFRSGLFKLN